MSLQPKEIAPVPDETARVARSAFPKGNAWLSLRDELNRTGIVGVDSPTASNVPRCGRATNPEKGPPDGNQAHFDRHVQTCLHASWR
jgi:hypothetical protein